MADKTHTDDQISSFLKELNTQTDRGAAIIAAAVLDELLQMVLVARFIELGSERKEALFERTGAPLSNLSARIEVAFAVGVINNQARLMAHFVREVRNSFAHRIEASSFDDPEVVDIIERRLIAVVPAAKQIATNRERFLRTFQGLAAVLYALLAADIRVNDSDEIYKELLPQQIFEVLERGTQLFAPDAFETLKRLVAQFFTLGPGPSKS
jgi:mannitol operon repressor